MSIHDELRRVREVYAALTAGAEAVKPADSPAEPTGSRRALPVPETIGPARAGESPAAPAEAELPARQAFTLGNPEEYEPSRFAPVAEAAPELPELRVDTAVRFPAGEDSPTGESSPAAAPADDPLEALYARLESEARLRPQTMGDQWV